MNHDHNALRIMLCISVYKSIGEVILQSKADQNAVWGTVRGRPTGAAKSRVPRQPLRYPRAFKCSSQTPLSCIVQLLGRELAIYLLNMLLTKCERNNVEQSWLTVSIHQVQSHVCYKETCNRRLQPVRSYLESQQHKLDYQYGKIKLESLQSCIPRGKERELGGLRKSSVFIIKYQLISIDR